MAATCLATSGNGNGTYNLKSKSPLEKSTTYVFTVTPDAANDSYTVDLQKQYDVNSKTALDNAISANAEFIRLSGNVTSDMLKSLNSYTGIRYLDLSDATLTELPDNLMQGKKNLEKVLLPNGLRKIGGYAFSDCSNLRVINLTRDLEILGKGMLMHNYRLHALSFDNREAKAKVTIPEQFIDMEDEGAAEEGLKYLYIGDNWEIDRISRQAFNKNHNLESFKYSETGTTIGDIRSNAFTGTYNLPEDDINNIIRNSGEIWNAAFYSCHNLKSLIIPESMKMIDNAAFGDCQIKDIYVNSTTSPAVPLYDASWYNYSWNYFSEYAFSGIRNKTNDNDAHVRQNAMTIHFADGVSAEEYRYGANEASDDSRVDENGSADEANGKGKYGEFLRLLTKSVYQDRNYDIAGQEHADLRIYRTFKNNWNTICLPVTLTDNQVKETFGEKTVVAEFTDVTKASDGNVLKFNITNEGIKAGKPYIIMLKDDYGNNASYAAPYSEEKYNGSYYDEYVTDKTAGYYLVKDITLPSTDNLPALQSVTHDAYTFVGNYNAMDISENNKVLYISNNLFRYKNKGENTQSQGYRAYFIIDESVDESGISKAQNFNVDETTGVVSIKMDKGDDYQPIYDLTGRMVGTSVSGLPAGIYIIKGKKYVIK